MFPSVGPVWWETRVKLRAIPSSLREGGVRELDDLSLKGDGHRGMQTKYKESSPWAEVSRETSWHTLWVWSMKSQRGGPG